jgi:hypothetical protein
VISAKRGTVVTSCPADTQAFMSCHAAKEQGNVKLSFELRRLYPTKLSWLLLLLSSTFAYRSQIPNLQLNPP